MEIADFVARAEGAEKKLASLTARCQELESAVATIDATRAAAPAAATASSLALSAGQKTDLLAALAGVRAALETESAEREALRKENEALKTTVRKLEYRCNHLVTMLEVEEKQVEALKKGAQ